METVLKFSEVSKKYGKKKVMEEVSFSICSGEVCGIVGANGSGKTTLLKLASNLIQKDQGKIWIHGIDMDQDYGKAIQNMGMCFDKDLLYENLTGYENLKLYFDLLSQKGYEINEVVEIVNMKENIHKKVKQMSAGMKQRLALARTIIGKPKIILMDEPVNALDPRGMLELYGLVKELSGEGIAFLISSHMLYDVERNCNSVMFLKQGKIEVKGKVVELTEGGRSLEEIYLERC